MTQPPIPEGETTRDLTEMVNKQDILILIHQQLYGTEGNAHQRSYNEAVWDIIGLIKGYHHPEPQAGGEPFYTKEQILESVRTKLHEVFGGLSKDYYGRKINTPYTVLGILHDAIPDFPLPEKPTPQ